MPGRRGAGLLVAVMLAGCAGSSSSSPAAGSARGSTSTPAAPSGPPLQAPTVITPAAGTTAPAGIPVAVPAEFDFTVPARWTVAEDSSRAAVHLVVGGLGSPQSIFMDNGPGSSYDPSSAIRPVSVGGDPGQVILDAASNSAKPGYRRIIQVLHNGRLFEVRCLGYAGFDRATLLSGCDAFVGSVRWRSGG